MPRLWIALALVGACRVSYLPPPSSRTDGGPVATRGTIAHESRSQVRLYRDAAGCESVQTVNRQFRVVTLRGRAGPERLVLEEAYDVRHCLTSGSTSSEATITGWVPDSAAAPPRFRISGRGHSGTPVGNLYRLVTTGCCGSAAAANYYSLLSGRLLFASSRPPLILDRGPTRSSIFIVFHDTFSAAPSAEASDSAVVGVLQVSDDTEPARRFVLLADAREPFVLEQLTFVRRGRPVRDTSLLTPVQGRAGVRLGLRAPGSGRKLLIDVPVDGDSLRPNAATLPAGVRWRQ
jgi:hypothetical protein